MPYTQTTLSRAITMLAQRLSDSGGVFWANVANGAGYNELQGYVVESLRFWNALTSYWRDRGTFDITSPAMWTDITGVLENAASTLIRSYNVTDSQLLAQIEFHLLEPATPASYSGTGMFTQLDLTTAMQNRLNQLLFDTGCVIINYQQIVGAGGDGRVTLPQTTIEIRRAAWGLPNTGSGPSFLYQPLWRGDEWEMNAFMGEWSLGSGPYPSIYSIIASQPLTLQLATIPSQTGKMDFLLVNQGVTINPTANGGAGVVLGIPDDLTWMLKWGAMADLLAKDGPACDPARASYCESRYQEGLVLAKTLPVIVNALVNGVPTPTCSIFDLDQFNGEWAQSQGAPEILGVAGANLITTSPLPDTNSYGISLDVVANAPIPALNGYLQIGLEELDAVLDYAQHLASFKLGGAEFRATIPLYSRMADLAASYNNSLRANSAWLDIMMGISGREDKQRPRRSKSVVQDGVEAQQVSQGG